MYIKFTNKEPFFISTHPNDISKKNTIKYNQILRQKSKLEFYDKAFDYIYNNHHNGDYFEFGVHKARTFNMALIISKIKSINMNFYAFDSFKGLPDLRTYNGGDNLKDNKNYIPFSLKTTEKNFDKLIKKNISRRKIIKIKGFYKDSLNKDLIKKFYEEKIKASFICVDCDLKQSIIESLNFSFKFMINGCVLYIDDFFNLASGNPNNMLSETIEILAKKNYKTIIDWHLIGSFGKSYLIFDSKDKK
jgi:O-methyltransferase